MFERDPFRLCGDTPAEVYLTVHQLTKHLMDKFEIQPRNSEMAEHLYPTKPLLNAEAITAWVFDELTFFPDLNQVSFIPTVCEHFGREVKEYMDETWGEVPSFV